MSQFLPLGADGKNLIFFAIRVYYEKLGHMLKPLVSKFRPDLSARLKNYRRETGPREAEIDRSSALGALLVWRAPSGHRVDEGQGVARQTLTSADKHAEWSVRRRAAVRMQRGQRGSQWPGLRRVAMRAPINGVFSKYMPARRLPTSSQESKE